MSSIEMHSTTILCVRKGNMLAMGGTVKLP